MKICRILPLAAAMALCFSGCFLLPKEAEMPALPLVQTENTAEYKTETVKRGDLALTAKVSFSYMALQKEDLSFPVSGERYGSIAVSVGDSVKAGDMVAELFSGSQDLEIAQIDSRLELLQIQYDAAAAELQAAKSYGGNVDGYETAAEKLSDEIYVLGMRRDELETEKDGRRLFAGIDGTVTYVKSIGQSTATIGGSTVITIANQEDSVFCSVTEYYSSFVPGEEYTITVGGTDYTAKAVSPESLDLESESREEKGVYKETVYLVLSDEDVFFESTSARGDVNLILDSRNDVLWLPKKAIVSIEGIKMVYIQDENGLRSAMEIQTGLEADDGVEVVSGLNEGDEVIVGQEDNR